MTGGETSGLEEIIRTWVGVKRGYGGERDTWGERQLKECRGIARSGEGEGGRVRTTKEQIRSQEK